MRPAITRQTGPACVDRARARKGRCEGPGTLFPCPAIHRAKSRPCPSTGIPESRGGAHGEA